MLFIVDIVIRYSGGSLWLMISSSSLGGFAIQSKQNEEAGKASLSCAPVGTPTGKTPAGTQCTQRGNIATKIAQDPDKWISGETFESHRSPVYHNSPTPVQRRGRRGTSQASIVSWQLTRMIRSRMAGRASLSAFLRDLEYLRRCEMR